LKTTDDKGQWCRSPGVCWAGVSERTLEGGARWTTRDWKVFRMSQMNVRPWSSEAWGEGVIQPRKVSQKHLLGKDGIQAVC
jgi:hypothetical protein